MSNEKNNRNLKEFIGFVISPPLYLAYKTYKWFNPQSENKPNPKMDKDDKDKK